MPKEAAHKVQLSGSRRAALQTLIAARERKAYVRDLLHSRAGTEGRSTLSARDADFAGLLALGVAATQGTLDEALLPYVDKPRKLSPEVLDALRICTYELLFLGKEPHAAVSQGVELVKSQAKSAAGMANAVLRKVAAHARDFMQSSPAHRYGLPSWLCARIEHDLGPAALDAFGAAGLSQAPSYIASLPHLLPDTDAQAAFQQQVCPVEPAGAVPGSWRAVTAKAAAACSLIAGNEPSAIITDYSAQMVAALAAPEPGQTLLELGSGRGTKTLLMAGHLFRRIAAAGSGACPGQAGTPVDASAFWAVDLHQSRVDVAAWRCGAAQVQGVHLLAADARDLRHAGGVPERFERVLLDAPCSGTGTLRRHPEITWSLTPEDVDSLAALQTELLQQAARLLAPGGILVYATCSVLCQENEDVVEAFLDTEQGSGFELLRPEHCVQTAELARELSSCTSPDGYLRTCVMRGGSDGHFAAVLRRRAQ